MYRLEQHPKFSYVRILTIPFSSIKKIDLALCKQPKETPDSFYARQVIKPEIVVNGGFFNLSDGATIFDFKDEGKAISYVNYKGMAILGNKELKYMTMNTQARDFVSAYPPLIVEGKKVSIVLGTEINRLARRTAVGWNKDNFYIVTVDEPGLKFPVLQDIFLELKVDYAINLDGGGSTRLLVNGQVKTEQVYARPVDNVLCVYLNKRVLYKVQVGAFSFYDNAKRLLTELNQKGYQGFVTKVNNLYKVQIGAFSIKDNAIRLRDELKIKGYNGFIVEQEVSNG